MGKGQKLYSKAKQLVAGGNMLLSKRPEMFLPEHWPATSVKLQVVKYGTWMEINILIH